MPAPTKFRCPDCGHVGEVCTTGTHPAPAAPRMDRNRTCEHCGCEFETREVVLRVLTRGDSERVAAARERKKHQPKQLRMLVPHDEDE